MAASLSSASAWGFDECAAGSKRISLDHGASTADSTGNVVCKRNGEYRKYRDGKRLEISHYVADRELGEALRYSKNGKVDRREPLVKSLTNEKGALQWSVSAQSVQSCVPSKCLDRVPPLRGPALAQSADTMATETFDIGSPLERLLNDRRVRIGGLVAGALVILTSMIVVNVAHAPSTHKALKSVAVLPADPLNIPIMRSWPYPETRRVESVSAPGAKVVKRSVLARR